MAICAGLNGYVCSRLPYHGTVHAFWLKAAIQGCCTFLLRSKKMLYGLNVNINLLPGGLVWLYVLD